MKTHLSRYLDDGRGYNDGRGVWVLEIERDDDYVAILDHIVDTDFYGRAYLAYRAGQVDDRITAHFWWVAQMAAALQPRRVVELGCGRGDVLRILQQHNGVDVLGIDFGSAPDTMLWPSLLPGFHSGDVVDVLRDWNDAPYDVACGFDIWEHLLPQSLDETVERLIEHSTDDALFLFVIPAFGNDDVFGEPFPLELEENRTAFENRTPFRFLVIDNLDEKVPAAGHLTWAHTDWWLHLFTSHGLVRERAIERRLHSVVDGQVPDSIKAFYVFRRDTRVAEARAATIVNRRALPAPLESLYDLFNRWRFERRTGATFTLHLRGESSLWAQAHMPGVYRTLKRPYGRYRVEPAIFDKKSS
jgi:hypothetical protein